MLEIQVVQSTFENFKKKWKDFVESHPNGNFFQSPAAFEVFQDVDGYELVLFVAEENGKIVGTLLAIIMKEPGLKGWFSRRCIIWGGPLATSLGIANALVKKLIRRLESNVIYIEFRNLYDMKPLRDVFQNNGFYYEERVNFLVPLISLDENWKILNENRKRQIKKSLKEGVKIIEAENVEQIEKFYYLLKQLYKKKVKKPLPQFSLFKNFFDLPNMGKFLLVQFNNEIIGGIMAPIYKDTIYEWYICGMDQEFKKQSPSVMATWAAIEYGIKNGLKYFDFMGAGKPNEDYGVREFKSKFGGKEVRYGRYIKVNNKMLYNAGKLGLKLMGGVKK